VSGNLFNYVGVARIFTPKDTTTPTQISRELHESLSSADEYIDTGLMNTNLPESEPRFKKCWWKVDVRKLWDNLLLVMTKQG